ncbi:MAG: hypothetical protein ISS69_14800 [Phycisphaerae bacterium]|nr:hypothetical protein [Phycisphaerae bacterium]
MALFDFLKPKWQHSNPEVRIAGIATLSDEAIISGLGESDPDKSVRTAALQRLDEIRPKWRHSQPDVRKQGIDALNDQSVLMRLVEGDPDESVREVASERLEQVRLSSFGRLTASVNPERDIEALLVMTETGTSSAIRAGAKKKLVDLLIEALCDKEAIGGFRVSDQTGGPMVNIQRLALASAARIVDDALVEPLVKIVSENNGGPYVLCEAIIALGNQRDKRGIEPLRRIIDSPDNYSSGTDVDAARGLVKIGDPEAIQHAVAKGVLYGDEKVDSLVEQTVDAWVKGDREKFDASFAKIRTIPDEKKVVGLLHMRFDNYFIGSSSVSKETWGSAKRSFDAIESALRDQRGYGFQY